MLSILYLKTLRLQKGSSHTGDYLVILSYLGLLKIHIIRFSGSCRFNFASQFLYVFSSLTSLPPLLDFFLYYILQTPTEQIFSTNSLFKVTPTGQMTFDILSFMVRPNKCYCLV